MSLDERALGLRVSVRRRHGDDLLTDAVGHLVGRTPDAWQVLRKDGSVVTVPVADVVAAKVVPPEPVRRGWEVPAVSPAELQRICSAGWPAREQEPLGDWVLRAHGGLTGRANSVLAVGSPGLPAAEALARVARWYAGRGLPPLVQLPLADPLNGDLAAAGWDRLHVTVVQVAPADRLLERLAPRPDLEVVVEPEPDADWQALMHDLDADDPAGHLAILTGPPVVGFATLRRGGEAVGIGRVSVEGEWAGITSVDVAPGARRQGVGSAVMRALVGWAAGRGAASSYLQVRAGNDAALRLYAALGYRTHHPYNYRAPAGA